jgi:hypothetical protein
MNAEYMINSQCTALKYTLMIPSTFHLHLELALDNILCVSDMSDTSVVNHRQFYHPYK